jgi:hypothetical protein
MDMELKKICLFAALSIVSAGALSARVAAQDGAPANSKAASIPTFGITPDKVQVPAYLQDGPFTYEWHAPGYSSLDLQSSINGGPWQPTPPINVPASGQYSDRIGSGTTYRFRFLPHGDSTNVLATLTVSGVTAPSPVFAANPVHLVTNAASANTLVNWNAAGYGMIDWCGSINAQDWQCGQLTTAASGSTIVPVPVGTTYSWRFYPHGSPHQGGTEQLLGELTIDCVSNSPPTFVANPAHMVVPADGSEGDTIITWNAGAYAQIDWCGKVGDGPWTWSGLSTPAVGNTTVVVPIGTYGYRFYAPGTATDCPASGALGELSVDATH